MKLGNLPRQGVDVPREQLAGRDEPAQNTFLSESPHSHAVFNRDSRPRPRLCPRPCPADPRRLGRTGNGQDVQIQFGGQPPIES